MFSPTSFEDLALLRETVELECKLAQGQSGQGELPKDFWPTYSAMANAHGGVVLLGVRETDGVFSIAGIPNPAKVRTDLFNNLNNPGKVSVNLLTDADVQELVLQGKTVVMVRIPQSGLFSSTTNLCSTPISGSTTVTGLAMRKPSSACWQSRWKMSGTPASCRTLA